MTRIPTKFFRFFSGRLDDGSCGTWSYNNQDACYQVQKTRSFTPEKKIGIGHPIRLTNGFRVPLTVHGIDLDLPPQACLILARFEKESRKFIDYDIATGDEATGLLAAFSIINGGRIPADKAIIELSGIIIRIEAYTGIHRVMLFTPEIQEAISRYITRPTTQELPRRVRRALRLAGEALKYSSETDKRLAYEAIQKCLPAEFKETEPA